MRTTSWILSILLLCVTGISHAADVSIAGNWKMVDPQDLDEPDHLLKLEQKDGKWTGSVVASRGATKGSMAAFTANEKTLTFSLIDGGVRSNYTIVVPEKKADVLYGLTLRGETVIPVELHRTTLTSLNRSVLDREILKNSTSRPEIIRAAERLVRRANDLKAKAPEVEAWVQKAMEASEVYGDPYKRAVLVRILRQLVRLDDLPDVTVKYALEVQKMVKEDDLPNTKKKILSDVAFALSKAGRKEEALAIEKQIEGITFTVQVTPYPGRASKSDRVVVVELFTGAQCPPCIAADLAFDGLHDTFKPGEVVLLQYHLHIPGPDPLTNADSEKRWKFYQQSYPQQVRGTPTIIFNGTPAASGGGGKDRAQAKYQQYNGVIRPLLEKASRAKLGIKAVRKGDVITIDIDASEVKDNAETTKLRLAIVEKEVSYTGGNGLPKHHYVVRGFVESPTGIALDKKEMKKTLTFDVAAHKAKLKKYLDNYNKGPRGPFPSTDRPMEMKDLYVIGLIQDDNSYEIVQASQAKVEPAE